MAGLRFPSWLRHDAAEPVKQAVNDGLPAEVAMMIEGLSFFDRGIADIETGEQRIIAMSANGRTSFAATRDGAMGWLRNRWPSLTNSQVSAGVELLHTRLIAFMRQSAANSTNSQRSGWANWRPLSR